MSGAKKGVGKRKWLRWLGWLTGAGLLAGLVAAAFWPQATPVELAPLVRGPLEETVREDGRTRVRERYTVSSPVAGRLARIRLKPGDRISTGQTLVASIEPSEPGLLDARQLAQAQARVSAAAAARERVEAAVVQAGLNRDRAKEKSERSETLFRDRAISAEEVEVDRNEFRGAEESLRMANYDREIARFELEQAEAAVRHVQSGSADALQPAFEIRAPVPGVVLRVLQESATVVSPGTPLVEIGDVRDLEIVADVLSTDAVRIAPGAPVRFDQWGGELPLPGRVRMVEPSAFTKISALGVEEQRVNVITDFADPAAGAALGDGFRVEAVIVTWSHPDVLQVPAGALFREQGHWAAFRVVDGRTELALVKTGHRSETMVEVLGGLDASDLVVLYPGDSMMPGAMVVPRKNRSNQLVADPASKTGSAE